MLFIVIDFGEGIINIESMGVERSTEIDFWENVPHETNCRRTSSYIDINYGTDEVYGRKI